jgi:hypothetical protein
VIANTSNSIPVSSLQLSRGQRVSVPCPNSPPLWRRRGRANGSRAPRAARCRARCARLPRGAAAGSCPVAEAGAAYIDDEIAADVGGRSDTDSGDNWGWTAGFGVEYAFSEDWSGRLDYRYSEYDGDGSFYEKEPDGDYDLDLDTSEVRVGVAYRF